MKISKIITKNKRKEKIMENISERKSAATSFPFLSLIPEIMGINAEFMAPSANNLLKRLGSLKATKKESET